MPNISSEFKITCLAASRQWGWDWQRQRQNKDKDKLPVKKPVYSKDDGDILWGQPNCLQNHHHGDQAGLEENKTIDKE